eukprot:scaffold91063_cov49-Attheya_sp.AAC.3
MSKTSNYEIEEKICRCKVRSDEALLGSILFSLQPSVGVYMGIGTVSELVTPRGAAYLLIPTVESNT